MVSIYALLLIASGAILSVVALRARSSATAQAFSAPPLFTVLRVLGLLLAVPLAIGVGPDWLLAGETGGLMWGTLVSSVAIIVPLGAIMLNLLASYGCLELVGTITRPLMRPLFRLPGRAALDDLTSWLGSYSVGLYLTRRLLDQGRYTRREAFTIATCFSTVSVGFVGVVASTLNLLPLFPLIFGSYFVVVYLVAIIQVRLWPTTRVPATYIATPVPESKPNGSLVAAAFYAAKEQAANASPMPRLMFDGFRDGIKLASTILGTILTVGLAALLLAEHTSLFDWLGAPIAPVLSWLGLEDAGNLAPAVTAGIAEMYIPALLVKDASISGRFFICLLSISQLVFFSSVGPMMLDMFRDVPIRLRDLLAIFLLRTALLVPILALWTKILASLGVFAGLD
jgi:nucleoside recognition membrane protein YjiH